MLLFPSLIFYPVLISYCRHNTSTLISARSTQINKTFTISSFLLILKSLGACKGGLFNASFPRRIVYLLHMSLSHAAPRKLRQSQQDVTKRPNHQLDSSRGRQTSLSLIEWDPQTIALRWACSIIVSLVLAAHNRWLYMLCLATEKENIWTWSVRLDPKGDTKEINSLSTDKEYSRREFRGTVWSKRELCFMSQYRKCGRAALCWHVICCCVFEVGRTERCSKCFLISVAPPGPLRSQ